MQSFLQILELIGTVAFAISGALVALKKRMDIFGVATLAIVTAVGGGAIRDIVLGLTPPMMFQSPIYSITAAITAIIVFLPPVRRTVMKNTHLEEILLLLMDSLGLGVFTVTGIDRAFTATEERGVFLLLFVGVITGVGGGVLRDVLAGDTPYIFKKHIYACASIAGALLTVHLWKLCGAMIAMTVGACAVITIRLCAAYYRWSLPK